MKRSQQRIVLVILTISLIFPSIYSQPLSFTEVSLGTVGMDKTYYPICQWVDYNNDGNLDVFYAIYNGTCLFRNDGGGSFTKVCPGFKTHGDRIKAIWRDLDNDLDQDLLIGKYVYINQGSDTFYEYEISELDGLYISGIDAGDYDNDGDFDIAYIAGFNDYSEFKAKIMINNNGMVEPSNLEFPSTWFSDLRWFDYDQNGWLDLVIHDNNGRNTSFYKNTGMGFELDTAFSTWVGSYLCTMNFADLDNNSVPDFIGSGGIIMNHNTALDNWDVGLAGDLMVPGDFDNDGLTDFITHSYGSPDIFLNNAGSYIESNLSFSLFQYFAVDWADYDKDGDLDAVCFGNINSLPEIIILENEIGSSNNIPTPPSSLSAIVQGDDAILTWNKGSDIETPVDGLFYNIYLIRDVDTAYIVSPDADVASGYPQIMSNGNAQQSLLYRIDNLEAGSYTWAVQSIDNGNSRSLFSSTSDFNIIYSNDITPEDNQRIKPGESGSLLTATETGTFNSHFWAYSPTQGGPYTSLGNSTLNYIPNFSDPGNYYVVFQSIVGSDTITSNEVYIAVLQFEEIIISGIPENDARSISMTDFDNDDDYDILMTAYKSSTNRIYENNSNVFTEVPSFTPTPLKKTASICFDYNNDGYIDILISGEDTWGVRYTELYKNLGGFTFELVDAGLVDVCSGSFDYGDFDMDNDFDILISGIDNNDETVTKLYRNDGNDVFTEHSVILNGVAEGSSVFIDFNRDNMEDIFLTGLDLSGNPFTKLYENMGDGQYELFDFPFMHLVGSHASWGDYNNDGFPDIILTGLAYEGLGFVLHRLIYKNLQGNDFEETLIQKKDDGYDCADWYDFDNDGTLDIILYSNQSLADSYHGYQATRILKNIGNDEFEESHFINKQITEKGAYALDFFRYDADSDLDFIQSTVQRDTGENNVTIFNNLSSTAKSVPTVPVNIEANNRGYEVLLTWEDLNLEDSLRYSYSLNLTDSTQTVYYIGSQANASTGFSKVSDHGKISSKSLTVNGLKIGKYYWQVQALDKSLNTSQFTAMTSFKVVGLFSNTLNPISPVDHSELNWGDYDNDNDLDLLIVGDISSDVPLSKIYRNEGNSSFVSTLIDLQDLSLGSSNLYVEWTDIDNDNLLDIIMLGDTASNANKLVIYQNLGNENFNKIYSKVFTSGRGISGSQGDLDNDGDIDFAICPEMILINNGDLTFTEIEEEYLNGYYISVADLDNDLDNDIICSTVPWINEGNQNFLETTGAYTYIDRFGGVEWFDHNGDGYIDVATTGKSGGYAYTKVFQNNKDLTFSEVNTLLKGTNNGNLAFGDYNNDGAFDLYVSGKNFATFAELYEFSSETGYSPIDYIFNELTYCSSEFADYDDDGDLDLVISGETAAYPPYTAIYENTKQWINTVPTKPSNLQAERRGYGIVLSWDEATDNESVLGGLSYNVRVGTTPGGIEITPPLADINSGYRKVARLGNAQFNRQYKLDSLPNGTYYWSVQGIDHSFHGGEWGDEQTFSIEAVFAGFSADTVCIGLATSFTDLSLTSGNPLTEWEWDFGDGNTSTLQNPTHTFAGAGTYTVQLTAISSQFADTIRKNVLVKAMPDVEFSADLVCQGESTTFMNNTTSNGLTISQWSWDFGDGDTETVQNPGTHGYLKAGDYMVELTALSDNGCSDTITKLVQVGAIPVASVAVSRTPEFCSGDSVILSNEYVADYLYQWKIGGSNLSGGDSSKYIAKATGDYTVEVTNPIGSCIEESELLIVTVKPSPGSPTISPAGPEAFCDVDSAILSVTNNDVLNYRWLRNGGEVGSDTSRYVVREGGAYTLEVINTDDCVATSINTVLVTVFKSPVTPTVGINGDTSFCEGQSVELSVTDDTDMTYQWMEGEFDVGGATTNSFTATTTGNYKLKVSSDDGCSVETKTVNVISDPAPIAPTIGYTGDEEFCDTDSLVLSVSDNLNYTYVWKLNGGIVGADSSSYTARATGDYQVEVWNLGDCSVMSANTVSLIVTPSPAIPSLNQSDVLTFCEGGDVALSVADPGTDDYQWIISELGEITDSTGTSITIEETGVYKVRVRNTGLCESFSQEKAVTVNAYPSTPVILTENYALDACQEEDPVILSVETVDAGAIYQWSRNGVPISGAGSSTLAGYLEMGDYAVEAMSNNCSVESQTLTIRYGEMPDKPSILAEGPAVWYLACSNDSATAYKWYLDGALIEGVTDYLYVAGTEEGKFEVAISENGSCFAKSDPVWIPLGTGIEQNPWENLKIYPNPTPGLFTLEMDNHLMGELIIDIFGETGSKIINIKFHKETAHFKTQIDLSEQPPAAYLIGLMLDKYRTNRTLIVE